MLDTFFEHKQHCHHHRGHMVMPGSPFSYLVISHAAFTFCVFKNTFDPISLPLHPCQTLKRGFLWRICQRNLEIRIVADSFRGNQTPSFHLSRVAVPNINSQPAGVYFQSTTSCIPKRKPFPFSFWDRITTLRTSLLSRSLLYFTGLRPRLAFLLGR